MCMHIPYVLIYIRKYIYTYASQHICLSLTHTDTVKGLYIGSSVVVCYGCCRFDCLFLQMFCLV